MTKFLFYSIVWIFNFSADVFASDENTSTTNLNSRYVGTWQGTWLEGMSSGKAKLEITEFSGQLSFTALPNFGAAPANLRKLAGNEKHFAFETAGADGRTMRFELKPSSDGKQLKGKAYYDSLHMEVEFAKTP